MTETPLSDIAAYRTFIDFPIRFSDQDAMGHVNNVAYAAYFESGRLHYFGQLLAPFPRIEMDFVLASLHIDYLREMRFPGQVRVGGRLLRVGRTSITTGYGAFIGDDCYATSTSVNVHIDPEIRRGAPFPAPVRAVLDAEMAKA